MLKTCVTVVLIILFLTNDHMEQINMQEHNNTLIFNFYFLFTSEKK